MLFKVQKPDGSQNMRNSAVFLAAMACLGAFTGLFIGGEYKRLNSEKVAKENIIETVPVSLEDATEQD